MVSIVIGGFGEGKTTMLKTNYLKKTKNKKRIYCLVKNDFADLGLQAERSFKVFVRDAVKQTNTMFVVDEARSALKHKEPDAEKEHDRLLITWLLNARKYNNMVFIVFHSFHEIPVWLLMYSHYILRFNTQDQLNYQRTRFSSYPNIVKSIDDFPTIQKYEYDEIKIR